MSSNLCMFDESLFLYSSPEMVPSCFSNFPDTHRDADFSESYFLDQFIAGLFPSHKIKNLSPIESTQLQYLSNDSNLGNGSRDSSGFEVKSEEFQMDFDDQSFFALYSYSGADNETKTTKFDREKHGFWFQNQFKTASGSPNFEMRRVCSTGDLQNSRTIKATQRSLSGPLSAESSFLEESSFNFEVRRYSAEEKKQKILKYRAKRNKRNFNKTIKYACRKTLADKRPRIRGRFARNDETSEVPKSSSCSTREEEDDGFPLDGFLEAETERGDGALMGLGGGVGSFMDHYGQQAQFQYYGY